MSDWPRTDAVIKKSSVDLLILHYGQSLLDLCRELENETQILRRLLQNEVDKCALCAGRGVLKNKEGGAVECLRCKHSRVYLEAAA